MGFLELPTLADVWSLRVLELVRAPTLTAALIYGAFLLWLFVLSHIVPGYTALGQPLADGRRLVYKLNGLRIFLLTLIAWWLACYQFGVLSPTLVYEHYGPLASVVFIFSCFVALYLYVSAHLFGRVGHKTGNFLVDFWLGVELNPRFGGLDLKIFALKPAMIGWVMVNLSTAAKQYELTGTLSVPMIVTQLLPFLYVFDYFWFEEKMLSTWDIIAENWGFMLVYGDLWHITFSFSFQAFYVLDSTREVGTDALVIACIMFAVGYIIFRMSNSEKDQFKNDPTKPIWGKKPETIGGRLLVSGWWGILRKPNYLGDLLIALSFSLPTGYSSVFAYFYPIYLTTLLAHRQYRDDQKCARKYGRVWEEYCARVPYVVIPGIL